MPAKNKIQIAREMAYNKAIEETLAILESEKHWSWDLEYCAYICDYDSLKTKLEEKLVK